MSIEENRAAAKRFVEEALDGGDPVALQELVWPGAVRHFPPGDVVVGSRSPRPRPAGELMRTDVHHVMAEGDFVTVHLTHHVKYASDGHFRSRIGTVDTGGKTVDWNAIAILRFENGRIAEEWVVRDELQVLQQLGVVPLIPG